MVAQLVTSTEIIWNNHVILERILRKISTIMVHNSDGDRYVSADEKSIFASKQSIPSKESKNLTILYITFKITALYIPLPDSQIRVYFLTMVNMQLPAVKE